MAAAGPLVNLLLGGLGYLVWNAVTNNSIGLIYALFLCGFNIWMFVINLVPAFPFDGGAYSGYASRPDRLNSAMATRLVCLFGLVDRIGMAGWGIFLILHAYAL